MKFVKLRLLPPMAVLYSEVIAMARGARFERAFQPKGCVLSTKLSPQMTFLRGSYDSSYQLLDNFRLTVLLRSAEDLLIKMVQHDGIAPSSEAWQAPVLLLN